MEKYEVKIFSTAKQDLLEIIDYLNTLSPETALRYYDKLTEEIGGLSHMPERCPRPVIWPWPPKDTAISSWRIIWSFIPSQDKRCRSSASSMGGGTIKTFCEDEWPGTHLRSRPLVIPR